MNAAAHEIDHELGVALATAAGIISSLECMQEREAFRELGGLLDIMSRLASVNRGQTQWVAPATFDRALHMLGSAQGSRSWLLLVDILRYEVTPILQGWKAMLLSKEICPDGR